MLFSQFINVFHNKLYLSKRSIHSKAHRYNTILNFPVPMQADSTSTESSPSFSFSLFLKFFYLLPSFLILFFFTLSFHFYNGKFGRAIPMTDGSRMIPRLIHILYHWFISGDQSGEDPNELRLAWITHKIPTPAKSTIHPNSKSQPHKI